MDPLGEPLPVCHRLGAGTGEADGSRENYRVGMDNTLYIEDKGLSNCRKAIIWSVMSGIAESIDAQPR